MELVKLETELEYCIFGRVSKIFWKNGVLDKEILGINKKFRM